MRLFADREGSRWEQKRQIAIAAAALIQDHDTILLDGGSTTYELARQLVGRPLQVVTNSLPVANLFTSSESDLVLIGGLVHGRTGVSLGPHADKMLSQIHVRRAVLSIAGADPRGFYNSHLLLVETERAMARSAGEVYIVADSSKFGHANLARICELHEVHTVVSDQELTEEWQKRLRSAGVRLILAGS
jgi:DeoR/GlpR family transcriptional regulator of sugar metabolism